MEIKSLSVGQLQTNCYLLWDESSSECFIIDPGDDADFITTQILELKLKPMASLLTHGHYDHCLACLELKLNFNIPIYLNPKDNFLYQNANKSAEHWSSIKALKQPHTLPLPKELKLGETTIRVISTPGHTPGSVCFSFANILFTGDTLFADGVGRTDFSYSSTSDLKKSLAKIHSYPPETLIYPGHEDTPIFLYDLKDSSF
jgi:glyoxylase-like metal-dependent hydrolase (beta-lactamase superfamily II)